MNRTVKIGCGCVLPPLDTPSHHQLDRTWSLSVTLLSMTQMWPGRSLASGRHPVPSPLHLSGWSCVHSRSSPSLQATSFLPVAYSHYKSCHARRLFPSFRPTPRTQLLPGFPEPSLAQSNCVQQILQRFGERIPCSNARHCFHIYFRTHEHSCLF